MKTSGIIILTIGLHITFFLGFGIEEKSKAATEISRYHSLAIFTSPYVGIAVMVAGVIIYLFGLRKEKSKAFSQMSMPPFLSTDRAKYQASL